MIKLFVMIVNFSKLSYLWWKYIANLIFFLLGKRTLKSHDLTNKETIAYFTKNHSWFSQKNFKIFVNILENNLFNLKFFILKELCRFLFICVLWIDNRYRNIIYEMFLSRNFNVVFGKLSFCIGFNWMNFYIYVKF